MKEKRIPTGVRKTTVLDPSTYDGGDYARHWFKKNRIKIRRFSGDPMDYVLSDVQEAHFANLSDILARNGLEFEYMGLAEYEGQAHYMRRPWAHKRPTLFRFVMTASNPDGTPAFVWEKFEGIAAGGGQNRVYVGGKKMKLTEFMRKTAKAQDKLVQGKA